ncbi:T9SS type B sorting domain-containing protein [Subsaximicrobium wynnwilliamsii]|uniref:T9SS type B sorting domain-containing protein n=1 Tax=Subsaximicrobium wynnwilliamsii TaxID=291179 RepID=A0A5C6ZJA7_9FLAO|nr:choice-of-anchor L domain-containing protein [Subsaximicrobium wynnwilliamsii]TXD83722.1 T9SS type B sorting domain-containing protein [Subsaximicrobium wynnwilliamsii]TXD89394.1 T9SS type B sorting domain-containing protein [Subsaximicrobium wynnwilliamsii]TXE03559.1 T9SS type B sorting domain-containing protein [Subsaximicrobium wynnwilliamsii]
MKKVTLLLMFCSIFGMQAQIYLQENFDTAIPATWTVTDEGGATGDSWISGKQAGTNSFDGTNAALVNSDANGADTHLIETLTSPVFDASDASALFLDFKQYYLNIGPDFSKVEIFDGTNWIEVLNQTATVGSFATPNEQHIDITQYANANMQVRFIYDDGDVWAWYWMVDDVLVYNSTCNFPSALSVASITETTADLSWTPGGVETAWELINQEADGPVPTEGDTGTATSNNPYTVSGLTLGTNYEFYVRANCGAEDGNSNWAGPFAYRVSGVGEVCGNPILIDTALPYTTTDSTSDYGDDYSGSPGEACGSGFGYLNGDDVVYSYTPAADTSIDITLSALNSNYAGIFVYTDCANIGTQCDAGAVNGFASGNLVIDNYAVTNGQTYYIVISTWAAPQSTDYTLTLTENTCVDPQATFSVLSDCDNAPQFFIEADLTSLGSASAVTISDDQGSDAQTVSALGIVSFGPFPNNTPVEITIANNDDANCVITSTGLTQQYCLDTIVDCTAGPINAFYCYQNSDTNQFSYTSTDGSSLRLTINSGEVEGAPWDFLVILDSDGVTQLYNGEGNDGDISGLVFQSSGDTIYFQITSDTSVSCESGSFSEGIDYTVVCATCVNPTATYNVVSDCVNGPQFFVDVDITDLGSASALTVTDNQSSDPQPVTETGTVTFGPFANNTPVEITISNDDDNNCTIESNSLTQEFCFDTLIDCSAGPYTVSYCYIANDTNQFSYTSNDGTPLNLTINSGEVEGDPFDFLIILDSDGVTELYNGEGNNGDLAGLTFQSTGDTIYFQIESDFSVSCESGTFDEGINYTVSCATCINPAATYQIVDDCDNGEQFLIDVNLSTIGDASSVTISNNVNADTTTATEAGIYQIGPFPFLTDVIVTLSNDQDVNCVVNSSAFQLSACPPENDNPCNATTVAVNDDASCTLFASGTLLEATPSGIASGSCAGNPNDDVWFQFTASSEFQIVQMLNIDSTGFFENIDHAVYSGSCEAPVELYCSAGEASITPELTVGDTYFVRVFSAGNLPTDYTFDLCIKPGTGNVTVDQEEYTVEQLVTDVLINSPCAQVTNITFSTGTNFGSTNGIGYFEAEEGSFPFTEGLVLTTGNASRAAGPNFDNLSDGFEGDWVGDADLDAIVADETFNATIVEFDFVPLSNEISFDFIMASEEYDQGFFECEYSDAFAFFLTDEDGNTTNLAVLPGTNTPILVTNIHPDNGSCPAVNEEYFGEYIPTGLPPISFDGRTAVFTAFSEVNLGETYHIKLVIADARDTAFDSGVFLKAGSFDIGEIDLGADITVEAGTATCNGAPVTIQTTAVNVNHVWYKDGFEIVGETSNVLTVTEEGTYTVQIIFSAQCNVSDEIVIEYLPLPQIAETPPSLVGCSIGAGTAVFTLEDNNTEILAGVDDNSNYTISYHLSEEAATNGDNALQSPYTSVSNPQTVYALVTNNTTGCEETTSFDLILGIEPETTFTEDFDYEVCPDAVNPIIITATAVNYELSNVNIQWYRDGQPEPIAGQSGLTLPVLEGDIYTIVVTFNDTGCSASQDIEVITLESCVIPQGISPNNDGKNDRFDLSNFRVTSLEIFNRYGSSVYEKTGSYVDEWFGQAENGDELPVGTYFYSIQFEDGERVTGWVYIQREN